MPSVISRSRSRLLSFPPYPIFFHQSPPVPPGACVSQSKFFVALSAATSQGPPYPPLSPPLCPMPWAYPMQARIDRRSSVETQKAKHHRTSPASSQGEEKSRHGRPGVDVWRMIRCSRISMAVRFPRAAVVKIRSRIWVVSVFSFPKPGGCSTLGIGALPLEENWTKVVGMLINRPTTTPFACSMLLLTFFVLCLLFSGATPFPGTACRKRCAPCTASLTRRGRW